MRSRQRTGVVRIAVLTSLIVLAGAWALAHAQSPTYMHGPGARGDGGMMLSLLLRSANLTPEQEAKVRETLTARRAASRALIDQLRQAQRELADRVFAPGNLEEADLAPQLQRIASLREQLVQENARVALEVRAILTPEQLARAAQVKNRMRELHNEMRQLMQPGRS